MSKKNTIFNSPKKRAQLFHSIKHELHLMEQTRTGKVLTKVGHLPTFVKNGIVQSAKTYTGWDYLEDTNVPWHAKILPTAGALVGCITGVPSMIAMACPVAQFLPPIMCVASFAKMLHDMTFLRQEYVERNLLRKELISEQALKKEINKSAHYKKLNTKHQAAVQLYTFGKRDIYTQLYDLRQQIIHDNKISRTQKEKWVEMINHLIEDFSQGAQISFPSDISRTLNKKYAHCIQPLTTSIQQYTRASNVMNHKNKSARINISKRLLHHLNKYRITQDRVHAQDLPQKVKDDIEKLLTGNALTPVEVQSLYAKIGNHFINITAKEQVAAQDQSHESQIIKYFVKQEDREALIDYYQLPRKVFDMLREIRINIQEHVFKDDADKITLLAGMNYMIKNVTEEGKFQASDLQFLQQMKPKLKAVSEISTDTFVRFNQQLTQSADNFQAIVNARLTAEKSQPIIEAINHLKSALTMHRTSSALQYAMGVDAQYDSPHIAFGDDKNNLILQAKKMAANTYLGKKVRKASKALSHELKKAKQEVTESLVTLILGEEELNARKEKQAAKKRAQQINNNLQQKFDDNNQSAQQVLRKANKLAILEKTAPARWISLELSASVFGLNLANTITLAAAAAPGAQPIVIATTMMSSVSTALTIAGMANDIRLSRIRYNKENKLNEMNSALTDGIKPNIEIDRKIISRAKSKAAPPKKVVPEVVIKTKLYPAPLPRLIQMQLNYIKNNMSIPILHSAHAPHKTLTYAFDEQTKLLTVEKRRSAITATQAPACSQVSRSQKVVK